MMMDTYQAERTGKPVCWNCSDSKLCEMGGMLKGTCPVCEEKELIQKINVKLDKRSKEFKTALKDLMDLGLTKEEAENKLME